MRCASKQPASQRERAMDLPPRVRFTLSASSGTSVDARIELLDASEVSDALPGGYTIGEKLYYINESRTWDDGDRIVHGEQAVVLGAALTTKMTIMSESSVSEQQGQPARRPRAAAIAWREGLLQWRNPDSRAATALYGEQGVVAGPGIGGACDDGPRLMVGMEDEAASMLRDMEQREGYGIYHQGGGAGSFGSGDKSGGNKHVPLNHRPVRGSVGRLFRGSAQAGSLAK